MELQPETRCTSTIHVVTIKLQTKSSKYQYIYVLKFHTVKILTQAKDMFVIRPKEVDHSLASYNKTCLFHSNTFYLFPGFSIKKLRKIPAAEMTVRTTKATLAP